MKKQVSLRVRSIAFVLVPVFGLFMASVASAVFIASGPGVVVPPINCGFDVLGTQAGWVRLHLTNDNSLLGGRDIWVLPGEHYPLDVADVEFFSTPAGPSPAALSFDDSQQCGYTRSYQLDECPYDTDIASNAGFYPGAEGSVLISVRNSDREQEARLRLGEFYPYDTRNCEFIDGSPLTYLVAVAP